MQPREHKSRLRRCVRSQEMYERYCNPGKFILITYVLLPLGRTSIVYSVRPELKSKLPLRSSIWSRSSHFRAPVVEQSDFKSKLKVLVEVVTSTVSFDS